MILVCVHSYIKSFLIYKFLILDTYHPYIPHLREQECENPLLLFETKRSPRAQKFWNTDFRQSERSKEVNEDIQNVELHKLNSTI